MTTVGKLDWEICDGCEHYDAENIECEAGVWLDPSLLVFDGSDIKCPEFVMEDSNQSGFLSIRSDLNE